MASEYIKYLTKDIPPDPGLPPPDRKARLKNWIYYHKWHLIIAAVLIIIACDLARSAFHIGETLPDVQAAYIGSRILPDSVLAELGAKLSDITPDANGDGHQLCEINSYIFPENTSGNETLASLMNASQIRLMADLENCSSFLFLLEDPAWFESGYHILAHPDGSLPESEEDPVQHPEIYIVSWESCPYLSALTSDGGSVSQLGDCDEAVLSCLRGLSLGRRIVTEERTTAYPKACEALWDTVRG